MNRQEVCVLLFLCIISLCSRVIGCDLDISGNCNFDGTGDSALCGWTLEGGFTLNSTLGGFVQLIRGAENGSLTSKEACSLGEETKCFRFTYTFDVINTITLSVSIYNVNDSKEHLLWGLSASDPATIWAEAAIPITANYSFKLVLRAVRLTRRNACNSSVGIDIISYSDQSCVLKPEEALPTRISTTPHFKINSCSSQEITSSTQKVSETTSDQASVLETSVTTSQHLSTNTVSSEATTSGKTANATTTLQSTSSSNGEALNTATTEANTLSHQPEDKNDSDTVSSNKLKIIIGVVVGVIVIVIIIIVLLLLLCRRKRRKAWKANNAQDNSDGRPLSNSAPSMQPPNDFAINGNPNDPQSSPESAMPEYAVVNKPRKVKQDNPPQSPYEMNDEDTTKLSVQHSEPPQQTGSTSKNSHYSLARNLGPRTVHNSLYDVPPGRPAAFSPEQGEDYNMLDFQGKSLAAQDTSVLAEEEEAGNAVYNRLNDGGDDTYNEVDRQRKAEVLGDEYSHISHL